MRSLRTLRTLLAVLLLTLVASSPSLAKTGSVAPVQGRVVGVSDGDTVKVLVGGTEVKVRLEGIDCPEKHQPWGQRAKTFTSTLLAGKTVTVQVKTVDRYGRLVARVLVRDQDVSLELLRAGLAWHFVRYNQEPTLSQLESEARADRRGLWADSNPVPPWDWRRSH